MSAPEATSLQLLTATIANGQTTSNAIDCGFPRAVRLSMPAAFTGVSLTLLALAADGVTYQSVYNQDGTQYTIVVAASREILLNLQDILSISNFKLVSSAAEGAERSIGVFLV